MLDPHYYDSLSEQMHKAAADQLSVWPLAGANYRELRSAPMRHLTIGSLCVKVINIPSRSISTRAKTDVDSLAKRPCFLCSKHRPKEQKVMDFEGAKGKKYHIQLNPYPIVNEHFVIPAEAHVPQSIWRRYVDMLRLAKRRPGFTILYNGPKCGASAPDHFHFQAVPSGILPLELSVSSGENLHFLSNICDAHLYEYTAYANGIFVIEAKTSKSMNRMFYRLLDCVDIPEGDTEPRFNLITFRRDGSYVSVVVMRRCHRSHHYLSENPADHLTMSPGCVDMFGLYVTVEREDYEKLSSAMLRSMVDEVTLTPQQHAVIVDRLTRKQTMITIPLAKGEHIGFEILTDGAGKRRASLSEGRVEYGGVLYDELFFEERNPSAMFAEASFLMDGPHGGNAYPGALRITVSDGVLCAENIVGTEDCVYSILCHCGETDAQKLEQLAKRLRTDIAGGWRPSAGEDKDGLRYAAAPRNAHSLAKRVSDASWGLFL